MEANEAGEHVAAMSVVAATPQKTVFTRRRHVGLSGLAGCLFRCGDERLMDVRIALCRLPDGEP